MPQAARVQKKGSWALKPSKNKNQIGGWGWGGGGLPINSNRPLGGPYVMPLKAASGLSEDPSLTTCFFPGRVGVGGWGKLGVCHRRHRRRRTPFD